MRTQLTQLTLITLLLAIAMAAIAGCSAQQREHAGQLADGIGTIEQEIEERRDEPVGDIADLIDTRLATMLDEGLLTQQDYDAAMASMQQALDEVDDNMPSPETVDLILSEMSRVRASLEAVANAPGDAEAVGEAITGAAAAAAPFLGPYGPWVTLGGAALASLITGLFGAKRGRTLGVRETAQPIDSARNRDLEASLAKDGKRYLVIDRDKVIKGHIRNGAATLIEQVTGQ